MTRVWILLHVLKHVYGTWTLFFTHKTKYQPITMKHESTTNNNNKIATKLFSNKFNESFFLIIHSFMEKNHLKKNIIKILKGIAKLL